MILSPPNIQTQLGEAISVIADSDFWKRWDTLIQVCWSSGTTWLYALKTKLLSSRTLSAESRRMTTK